jgi:hypothetical protein
MGTPEAPLVDQVTGQINYAAMRSAAKVLSLQELVWLAHAQELAAEAEAEKASH